MNLSDVLAQAFSNINWLAVVVAGLATFVVGSVWYHEKTLGNKWMKAVGLKRKDLEKANMLRTFGLSLILSLLSAVFLSVICNIIDVKNTFDGGLLGGVIGTFFVAASVGTNYLFAQRSFDLFAIDASYNIVNFVVLGAIIGAF